MQTQRKKQIAFLVVAAVLVSVSAALVYFRQSFDAIWARTRTSGPASMMDKPPPRAAVALEVPTAPMRLVLRVDVDRPDAWLHWLEGEAEPWLQTPLGQGFVGTWAGWFGSKGEELNA